VDTLFVCLRIEQGLKTLLVDLGRLARLRENIGLLPFAFACQKMREAVEDGAKVIPSSDQRSGAKTRAHEEQATLAVSLLETRPT
jgi:hypothetical protein